GVRDVAVMAGVLPPHDDDAYDLALGGVPSDALKAVPRHAVDPNFLRVLSIGLVAGRNLAATDRQATPPVALVSRSLAGPIARAGPAGGGGALGRRFQLIDGETRTLSPPIEIVGVVEDVLYRGPRPIAGRLGNRYEVYVPLAQAPGPTLSTAVLTAGDPAAL